jgi:hypothetical protein
VDPTDEQGLMAIRRFRLATSRTALIVGAVVLLLTGAQAALDIASHAVNQGVLVLPFGIVGYVIARRQPRNPIGWILLGIALAFLLATDGGQYAVYDYRLGHPGMPLARLGVFLSAGWVWLIVLLPLAIGLFPDGQLSRRWRFVLRVYIVYCSLFLAVYFGRNLQGILAPHIKVDSTGGLASLDVSYHSWEATATHVLAPLFVVFSILWVGRQVYAFRGSTGDRRQQLKWLMSGGGIAVFAVATLSLGVTFMGIVALPIGLGIGVLKYRLYEIDRLISRTLSYAIVTGLLVGVYVGMIALTTHLIPLSSSVGVAASTLVAVGLFTPVRRRVQRRVDHRFNRSRYDSEAMVATFSSRLRDAVQLETVRTDLLNVVNSAVEPSQVSLWIRPMSRVS